MDKHGKGKINYFSPEIQDLLAALQHQVIRNNQYGKPITICGDNLFSDGVYVDQINSEETISLLWQMYQFENQRSYHES